MLSDLHETAPLTGTQAGIPTSFDGPRAGACCTALHCSLSSLFSACLQEFETRWPSITTLCDFMWEFSYPATLIIAISKFNFYIQMYTYIIHI